MASTRAGERNENDVIHAGQGRQAFKAQLLVEIGPTRPFVYELIRRQRDHECITQGSRFLQVQDVAGMDEVEDAVRLHQALAARPERLEERGSGGERNYFRGGHRVGLARRELVGLGGARNFHELHVVVLRGVNVRERTAIQRLAKVGHLSPDGTDRLVAEDLENFCGRDVVIAFVERVGDLDFDVQVLQFRLG